MLYTFLTVNVRARKSDIGKKCVHLTLSIKLKRKMVSSSSLGLISAEVFLQFLQNKLLHYNFQVYNKVSELIRSGLYEFCPIVQAKGDNQFQLTAPFTHLKPMNAIDAMVLEAFAITFASAAGSEITNLSTLICSQEQSFINEVAEWDDIGSVIILDVFPSLFQDRDNEDFKDFIFSSDWTEALPLYNLLESFFESHLPLSDKDQVDIPLVPYLGLVIVDSYMEKQIFRPLKEDWFSSNDSAIKVTRSFTNIVIGFPSSYSLEEASSLIITHKLRLDSTFEYEIEKEGAAPIFNYRSKGGSKILLSNGGKVSIQ